MRVAGRLEDQPVADVLRVLARGRASGKLTLTRRDGHALLAFRAGRIIYAASSAVRQTFGSILVLRGLVSEDDLMEALERQHKESRTTRLGQVLVEMGRLDEKALREVMRQQTESVIADLVQWKSGFYQFESLDVIPGGEVEVDVKDFVLAEGVSPQEMLGDEVPAAPSLATGTGASASVSLSEIVSGAGAPAFTGEVTLRLMRYAAQVFPRGVLFVVRPDEVRGMGQFGVQVHGHSPSDQVRDTVVPLAEPSVLGDVVERGRTYRGPLEDTRGNRYLVDRLGGSEPTEVVVIPMTVRGVVAVLFYGDNAPDCRPIGPTDPLEFMIAETAVAMERGIVEGGPPPRKDDRGE